MKDLLKEAIADAKAVRETALANAKLALEEAFAPRIQSMISSHLSEMEGEDEEMTEEDDMMMDDEMTDTGAEEMPAAEVPAAEAPEMEAPAEEEPMAEEDDMDLEEIIRELEGEGDSMEEADEMEEAEEEMTEAKDMEEGEEETMDEGEDEEVDIQEVIRALREEDEEEKVEKAEDEEKKEMAENLKEAIKVIKFLRSKINEVNLLNAKLLYSNKLFRGYSLNESQKLKVIENFDRAHSLREVKLLYTALAENFAGTKGKKVVKESFASKPVASTKPTKTVLNEGEVLANRFKKLAGLIK